MKAPYLLIPALFAFGPLCLCADAATPAQNTTVVSEDEDMDADEDLDAEELNNPNNAPRADTTSAATPAKPTAMGEAPAKTADVKPTEVKPTDVKPADAKPADVKPTAMNDAAKPAEVKPAQTQPGSKGCGK